MGWIGVDLDKTLAKYPSGGGMEMIGNPIPAMVSRVLDWCNAGKDVRIFTARAAVPELVPAVEAWCLEHLGRKLPVTNQKDFSTIAIYDDIAIQVEANTGRLIGL